MSADPWADLDAESRAFLSQTLGGAAEPASTPPTIPVPPAPAPSALLSTLVGRAHRHGASDLHLTVGTAPHVRVHGDLIAMPDARPLTAVDVALLVDEALSPALRARFDSDGDVDTAFELTPGEPSGDGEATADRGRPVRVRASVFRQQGHPALALRLIQAAVPALSSLGLPPAVEQLVELRSGLVLVTGETGSGKSTTLAALVSELLRRRPAHVLTIEDPIEYLIPRGRGLVRQREIGLDTESFATALRHALRQDPDVILLGELRDLETISTALTAAETGHLVLATLHSSDASGAVHRLVDVFTADQQAQVRSQLSLALQAICSQQLLASPHGSRVAATEVLLGSSAVRNLIREDKVHQLPSVLETSVGEGMHTFDQSLVALVRAGRLDRETALAAAHHADRFEELHHR
ncbi:MAG: type IV pilus twitching motility protein PilT [Acidimicrobiales bacterium]